MISSTGALGTTTYVIDPVGQRVRKTNGSEDSVFHYDTAGHLISTTTVAGAVQEDIVWLGDKSISVIRPNAAYYIHSDHLDTPRAVTDGLNVAVWKNAPTTEPFGDAVPEEDPNSTGTNFKFNLRFSGQYFDKETNTSYNYFRDYDPSVGRYVQSDPIGLSGGINTYAYVGGEPLRWIDFLGLAYGDLPPSPPGYNRGSWPQGEYANGKPYVIDPEGRRWLVHPEDDGHWRHWDIQDKNGKNKDKWPPNSNKPRPGQKKLKPDQCEKDPSGDAPSWTPADPDLPPGNPKDMLPFVPGLVNPPGVKPIRVPGVRGMTPAFVY